jgi:transcriptional regulator with XRE-family HTH domain
MLPILIKRRYKEQSPSSRQIALEVGVSHSTIMRALRGDLVDVGTILKLSKWLGVKPNTLINAMATEREDKLADQIAVMLESSPMLETEFRRAVDAIVAEKLDPHVLEDIASYAAYRINMKISQG